MEPSGVQLSDSRIIIPDMTQTPRGYAGTERVVLSGEAFATTWQVTLHANAGLDAAALRADIEACLASIDAQMSPYRSDSDLTRFNQASAETFVDLPAQMMQVVRHALSMAQLTHGAFDPCLLPAVSLWGFGPVAVAEGLPDAAKVAALRGRDDWRDLMPLSEGMVQPGGVALDLNAIAKGYAVDAVMEIVRKASVHAALVEIGGELKGWGVQPDALPWWVGVESETRTVIALCDWAVATSGDGVRAFVHDGQVFSHTLDPVTQSPILSGIASVTVLDELCWRADALATALMVMGETKGLAFASHHDIPCLMRVRDGERVREAFSPRLEAWL